MIRSVQTDTLVLLAVVEAARGYKVYIAGGRSEEPAKVKSNLPLFLAGQEKNRGYISDRFLV